jgi:hypothetical protein
MALNTKIKLVMLLENYSYHLLEIILKHKSKVSYETSFISK